MGAEEYGGGTAILNRIRVRVRGSLSLGTFEQRSEGGRGDSQTDIQQEGVPGGGTGQCKRLEAGYCYKCHHCYIGIFGLWRADLEVKAESDSTVPLPFPQITF